MNKCLMSPQDKNETKQQLKAKTKTTTAPNNNNKNNNKNIDYWLSNKGKCNDE